MFEAKKLDVKCNGHSSVRHRATILMSLTQAQLMAIGHVPFIDAIRLALPYNDNVGGSTDRSKLMAARLRIDAVQQRTSNAIHVSHRASPRPHLSLFT